MTTVAERQTLWNLQEPWHIKHGGCHTQLTLKAQHTRGATVELARSFWLTQVSANVCHALSANLPSYATSLFCDLAFSIQLCSTRLLVSAVSLNNLNSVPYANSKRF